MAVVGDELRRAVIRRAVQVLLTASLWFVAFFLAAGTLSWRRVWWYAALSLVLLLVNFVWVMPRNPEVIAERGRLHEGTKGFDKVFTVVFSLALLAAPVVAGLDAVRFGWSVLSEGWAGVGLVVVALGNLPITWAMGENPHLETTVRIQEERAHRVIDTGPYRLVRHPMYTGILLQQLAVPLVCGSLWAYLPAGLIVGALVVRTALEDRTLQAELPGYREFTTRTRYRLLPGLW
ncbi:MAG: isoprenylcysteine carboxylmethyltransferase family protein [Deltaproteobacteria bacterium]|nr:isoprenylcysteine carboxylmethyltransferase family protein [Deltaproteobacteria bacterium]